jgi:hypothetical protein
MYDKKEYLDEIYDLVIECRQIGILSFNKKYGCNV